uniref:Uncharacterized protein n=1 Tax=Acrobeloides nanus TaxID=290746 RepID=A0A914DHG7_9BILA
MLVKAPMDDQTARSV